MKYLKKFENKSLKKYLIIYIPNRHLNDMYEYQIIKIMKKIKNEFNPKNDLQVSIFTIYKNKNGDYTEYSDGISAGWTSYETLKNMIVYQSDSLEDCKKELQIYINSKKYNL